MSHERDDHAITFSCDACPMTHKVSGSDFAVAHAHVVSKGWRSLKRVGQPWSDFCPGCVPQAERDHNEHKRREEQRERIKARNA